ncbi:MAG TPA: hypothetical protein ENI23_10320 [bacterium]|nr:hypothetical protein [bacterium]
MDTETKRILSELAKLTQKVDRISQDLRVSDSGDLGTQIREINTKVRNMEMKLTSVGYAADSIRKSTATLDAQINEIRKALALIYKNTDELEDNLLEGPRKTR